MIHICANPNTHNLSSGYPMQISKIFFMSNMYLKLFDSSSGIKRLRFVNCPSLTDEGLSEVASKFPLLEDLDFSKCDKISSKSLQLVTCSFPFLKSCKLNSLKLNVTSERKWHCNMLDYCHG